MTEYTLISDLAKELKFHKSSIHKKIARKGLRSYCIKVDGENGQKLLAVPNEKVPFFQDKLKRRCGVSGYVRDEGKETGWGYFYALQTMPEYNPTRIKFGFAGRSGTTSVSARLSDYRTALGNEIVVLAEIECHGNWEKAAIDCATKDGCYRILGAEELYQCDSVNGIMSRLNEFFKIMPRSKHKIESISNRVRLVAQHEFRNSKSLFCIAVSKALSQKLNNEGYEAKVIRGRFDGNGHAWVECEGKIIDLTMDQFGDFPPVYICESNNDSRYVVAGKDDVEFWKDMGEEGDSVVVTEYRFDNFGNLEEYPLGTTDEITKRLYDKV